MPKITIVLMGAAKQTYRIALLIVMFMACSAIAGAETQDLESQANASLLERATQYWEARELNDLHTAYALESAALPGGWLTPMIMSRQGLAMRNVTLELVELSDDLAQFRVNANVEIGSMGFMPQEAMDFWIKIDNRWYRRTPEL